LKKEVLQILELPSNGIYTLILFLSREIDLKIGKLGEKKFQKGYYIYTGSALGKGATNLRYRIARHLRKKKRKFWHIDYLLANNNMCVEAVIAAETKEDMECTINNNIKKIGRAKIQVKWFGASDCRKNCGSHLLYFPKIKKADFLVQKLIELLKSSSGVRSVCVIN
jgi:Uri superfamily endonuclease